MAKDLVSEQQLPSPIAFATGDTKLDAALAALAEFPHSPSHPSTRPFGPAYNKAVKAANKATAAQLRGVLKMPGLLEVGKSTWDETRYNKLPPARKKAYNKATDAASTGRKIRIAFVSWLFEAVRRDGHELLAILANSKLDPDVRYEAFLVLRDVAGKDKKQAMQLVAAVDRRAENVDESRLLNGTLELWHLVDPKGAFEALRGIVIPKNHESHYLQIDAIATSIWYAKGKVDKRWAPVIASMVGHFDVIVTNALTSMPVDPAVIPPILKALGPLDKITYLYDGLISAIARVGTMEIVPLLQQLIRENPDDADTIIDAVPRKAKAVIAALKATPLEDREEPAAERPVLTFRKAPKFKAPKLPTLAKQEAQYRKLFADAGIPTAYDKVAQRSVLLIPTRVDEPTLKVGATKLGGHPDLPADAKWPYLSGEPLTFLAQLNFADFDLPELPKAGTLAIFVDNNASSERGDYLQNAKALYAKAGAKLARREVPDDFVDVIYQACKVELVDKLSLPSPSNAHATKALDEETLAVYEAEVWSHEQDLPKVLGYRDYGYDGEEPATARLLLQLPGDNQSDMEFGDADPLSIFIGVKDLANGKFTKVWPRAGD